MSMKTTVKYIIMLIAAFVGIYNIVAALGTSSPMPVLFAVQAFSAAIYIFLHKEDARCEASQ